MNAFWLRVCVGAATVLFIIFSTVYYFLEPADTTAYERIPTSAGTKKLKELEMVCELAIDIAGAKTLGIDAGEPARISVSKIDFEKKSGWYQGNIAISEGRAGTLTVTGPLLKVYRPAMFQRFGKSVSGEEFTIDRSTGKFRQYLTFSDDQKVNLISGQCAMVTRPPF